MLKHIDDRLKEWAVVASRRETRGLGYPSTSPLVNFGMPSGRSFDSFNVWAIRVSDVSDIQRVIDGMESSARLIVMVYYIKSGLNKSKASRILNMARSTFIDRMTAIHLRINDELGFNATLNDKVVANNLTIR